MLKKKLPQNLESNYVHLWSERSPDNFLYERTHFLQREYFLCKALLTCLISRLLIFYIHHLFEIIKRITIDAFRDPNEPKYSHNEFGVLREKTANRGVSWEPYNPNTQMYLSLGQYVCTKIRALEKARRHSAPPPNLVFLTFLPGEFAMPSCLNFPS